MPHSFEVPPGWNVTELPVAGEPGETHELGISQFAPLDETQMEIPGYVAAPDGVTALLSPQEVVFRAGQVDTYAPEEQRLFASMDEARAYTETEEYRTLVRILSSLRLPA